MSHLDTDPPSLAGRRFVVLGDGRLVTAVTAVFEARDAAVERIRVGPSLRADLGRSLEQPADCVLALDDRHEENLRAALMISELNERAGCETPIVVRAFDPALADEIERKRPGVPFRVRGAYSVAHLAAPDFVVSALVDEGEENLVTLRLADEYVNVCRLQVRAAERAWRSRRRPLLGRTPGELLSRHGCQVLARRASGGAWHAAGDEPLAAGEEVLVGGQLLDVLRLVRRQGAGGPTAPAPRPARLADRRRDLARSALWRLERAWFATTTLSTRVFVGLLVLVTATVAFAPVQGPSDRFYLWVLTALGNPPQEADQPSAVVSAIGLLAGGVALGLGISLMSAYFIERRVVETARRRASRLHRHVVVVGLGEVGLRITQLLERLGVPCAVVDTSGSPARGGRHASPTPVLAANLEAGLPDARIDRASSVIATSEDNLLNVEACLRAKRASHDRIRTVARIFDDVEARLGARAFGVDDQIAAVIVAAPTFVDAAVHDEGMRSIECDGRPMAALRWPIGHPVGSGQMRRWHEDGIRLLAVWQADEGARRPESEAPGLHETQAGILVGPRHAMAQVLEELRRRTDPRPAAASAP